MLAQRIEQRGARIEPQFVTRPVDGERDRNRIRIGFTRRFGGTPKYRIDDDRGRGCRRSKDERAPRWIVGLVVIIRRRVARRKGHESSAWTACSEHANRFTRRRGVTFSREPESAPLSLPPLIATMRCASSPPSAPDATALSSTPRSVLPV